MRDVDNRGVWSLGQQPPGRSFPGDDAAQLSEGGARFIRRAGTLAVTLDVAVDGDVDAELRLVTIANRGDGVRTITLTSYAELVLVLGSASADAAQQAFSKLFVQTEAVADGGIVLATSGDAGAGPRGGGRATARDRARDPP